METSLGKARDTDFVLFTGTCIVFAGVFRTQRNLSIIGERRGFTYDGIFYTVAGSLRDNHDFWENLLRMDVCLWSDRRLDLPVFWIFAKKDRKKTP